MFRIKASIIALAAVVALAAVASIALATTPSAFKLTTAQGKKGSFTFTGYEFFTASNSPVSKPAKSGTLMVDVKIASNSEKTLLKKGKLKAASLHVLASLPKPQNFTYTLGSPKITSVDFVDGHFGEVGAVNVSYKSIKKS
jgi:hypothetical protein